MQADDHAVYGTRLCISRAVEVAFKKPRFLGFLKKPKNPKVQILGFLGFLFLKIVIVFSITY